MNSNSRASRGGTSLKLPHVRQAHAESGRPTSRMTACAMK
jgi:hypothetical protein